MKNKSYKVFFALLISGALLVGVFFYIEKQNAEEIRPSENIIVKSQNTNNTLKSEIDTDNDGLLDWEETLWGTDLKKQDTDNDKTIDGEEVKLGRNPTIPGPKDLLNSETKTTKVTVENTTLTPTEKLGRDMFAQYLSLKQSGVTFDEQTTDTFVNELIQKMAGDMTYKVYTEKNISIASQDNPETIKTYGNALSESIRKNSSENENELIIFSRFADSGDKKELLKLMPIITSYKGMLNGMLVLSVPKSALEAHLKFVNALSLVLKSLENMAGAETDPLINVITIERHLVSAQELKDSITKLQTYFIAQNIDFTQ